MARQPEAHAPSRSCTPLPAPRAHATTPAPADAPSRPPRSGHGRRAAAGRLAPTRRPRVHAPIHGPDPRREPPGDPARERGAVSAELAIATPLLLVMILAVVQFAVAEHARHIAQAVAVRAADTARRQGGSAPAGQAAGQDLLRQLGPTLTDATLQVHRDPDQASAVVTGRVETVLPGLSLHVTATSSGPVERLRATAPRVSAGAPTDPARGR